jgi:hypothetical protein
MPDDLRDRIAAALRAHEAEGVGADPNLLELQQFNCCVDAIMSEVSPAMEWLMAQAEEYQTRAHAAEKVLAAHGIKVPQQTVDR